MNRNPIEGGEMTRRGFLRLALIGFAGSLLASKGILSAAASWNLQPKKITERPLPAWLKKWGLVDANPELIKHLETHPEKLEQLAQIISSRKEIGLKNLPREILEYNPEKAEKKWLSTQSSFENDLPPSMNKTVETIKTLIETVYGPNVFKAIRGIVSRNGTMFIENGKDARFFGFPIGYNVEPINLIKTILHEAAHGVDPGLCDYYPPDMFFALEVAKWEMLSRSLSIEELYLRHPEDRTSQRVAYEVGKHAVFDYLTNYEFDKLPGATNVKNAMISTKNELEENGIRTEKYTKKYIYELGKRLVSLLREGGEYFIQQDYEDSITNALIEVYADQIMWGLLPKEETATLFDDINPSELTQDDNMITTGIVSTIAAIREEPTTDLEVIRNSIRVILSNLRADTKRTTSLPPLKLGAVGHPTNMSPGSVRKTTEPPSIESIESKMLRLIADFISGKSAQLTKEVLAKTSFFEKSVVEKYLKYYRAISQKYPNAGEQHVFVEASIEAFDPPSWNAWESERVTEAMANDRLREILTDVLNGKSISSHIPFIKENLPILENFANIERLGIQT